MVKPYRFGYGFVYYILIHNNIKYLSDVIPE